MEGIKKECNHCWHPKADGYMMVLRDGHILQECCMCNSMRQVHRDHALGRAMTAVLVLCLFCSFAAFGQKNQTQPVPASASQTPPTIPSEVLKRFWRADAAQQRAQRQLDQAQAASQNTNVEWHSAVKEMTDVCGDKYEIKQKAADQDPYCAVKK